MPRTEYAYPVNIRHYYYATTDNPNTYPTSSECGAGSTITLINTTAHAVSGYLEFDGTNWNTL
jgi:hypothetical protein